MSFTLNADDWEVIFIRLQWTRSVLMTTAAAGCSCHLYTGCVALITYQRTHAHTHTNTRERENPLVRPLQVTQSTEFCVGWGDLPLSGPHCLTVRLTPERLLFVLCGVVLFYLCQLKQQRVSSKVADSRTMVQTITHPVTDTATQNNRCVSKQSAAECWRAATSFYLSSIQNLTPNKAFEDSVNIQNLHLQPGGFTWVHRPDIIESPRTTRNKNMDSACVVLSCWCNSVQISRFPVFSLLLFCVNSPFTFFYMHQYVKHDHSHRLLQKNPRLQLEWV